MREAIERWLEFHDSDLVAVHETAGLVRVDVDAYVHQWEGEGATRRGTGWMQRVMFEIENARVEMCATSIPCGISDGRVRSELLPPEEDGILLVPTSVDGACVLEMESVNGEMTRIAGSRLRVVPSGEARFVEPLPTDMDPDHQTRDWS